MTAIPVPFNAMTLFSILGLEALPTEIPFPAQE
jgi:hypothetical protein